MKKENVQVLSCFFIVFISVELPFISSAFFTPAVWLDMGLFDGKNTLFDKQNNLKVQIDNGVQLIYDRNLKSGVASFDGHNGGVTFKDLNDTCLLQPSTCENGITFSFWFKLGDWSFDYIDLNIIQSKVLNIQQFTDDTLPIEIWNGTHSWSVFHLVTNPSDWNLYSIAWNNTCLQLYVNSSSKEWTCDVMDYSILISDWTSENSVTFGKRSDTDESIDGIQMQVDDIKIWNNVFSSEDINQLYTEAMCKFTALPRKLVYIQTDVAYAVKQFLDFALSSHTFKELEASSVPDCYQKCLLHSNCISFNFRYEGKSLGSNCQLNNRAKETMDNFDKRKGFIYYEIQGERRRLLTKQNVM